MAPSCELAPGVMGEKENPLEVAAAIFADAGQRDSGAGRRTDLGVFAREQ